MKRLIGHTLREFVYDKNMLMKSREIFFDSAKDVEGGHEYIVYDRESKDLYAIMLRDFREDNILRISIKRRLGPGEWEIICELEYINDRAREYGYLPAINYNAREGLHLLYQNDAYNMLYYVHLSAEGMVLYSTEVSLKSPIAMHGQSPVWSDEAGVYFWAERIDLGRHRISSHLMCVNWRGEIEEKNSASIYAMPLNQDGFFSGTYMIGRESRLGGVWSPPSSYYALWEGDRYECIYLVREE